MHCYYVFALRLLIVVLLLNSVSYVTGTLAFDTVVRMYVSSHVFLFCCCMLFLLFIVYCSFLPYYGEYRSIFLFLFYLL